jgi:hypothetical protein
MSSRRSDSEAHARADHLCHLLKGLSVGVNSTKAVDDGSTKAVVVGSTEVVDVQSVPDTDMWFESHRNVVTAAVNLLQGSYGIVVQVSTWQGAAKQIHGEVRSLMKQGMASDFWVVVRTTLRQQELIEFNERPLLILTQMLPSQNRDVTRTWTPVMRAQLSAAARRVVAARVHGPLPANWNDDDFTPLVVVAYGGHGCIAAVSEVLRTLPGLAGMKPSAVVNRIGHEIKWHTSRCEKLRQLYNNRSDELRRLSQQVQAYDGVSDGAKATARDVDTMFTELDGMVDWSDLAVELGLNVPEGVQHVADDSATQDGSMKTHVVGEEEGTEVGSEECWSNIEQLSRWTTELTDTELDTVDRKPEDMAERTDAGPYTVDGWTPEDVDLWTEQHLFYVKTAVEWLRTNHEKYVDLTTLQGTANAVLEVINGEPVNARNDNAFWRPVLDEKVNDVAIQARRAVTAFDELTTKGATGRTWSDLMRQQLLSMVRRVISQNGGGTLDGAMPGPAEVSDAVFKTVEAKLRTLPTFHLFSGRGLDLKKVYGNIMRKRPRGSVSSGSVSTPRTGASAAREARAVRFGCLPWGSGLVV